MQRIFQQLLNDVVVKAIADNPVVQRVAYSAVEGLKNAGKNVGEAAANQTGRQAGRTAQPSRKASTSAPKKLTEG